MKLTTPITLPPSELKASPHIKSKMEAEETIEKPNGNGNGQNEKQVTNIENKTKEKGIRTTKLSGSEGIRVITISGENTGLLPSHPDVLTTFETGGSELLNEIRLLRASECITVSERVIASSTLPSTSPPLQCLQARRRLSASERVATATSSSRTAEMARPHRSSPVPWTSPTRIELFRQEDLRA
ncbi:hypothetical protein Fmac_010689 [Flemingia macrophylla]|uniref:Uncharacterized protein n=1 Tax=Flemingia macrophylla TaxID=520843 RepID=A0ABD1ML48_9FABA